MFSCLGSKRNTRNCVVNPQSRTRTVDLSESRKKHEELKEELINLRKTRKKSKTGKSRFKKIAGETRTKIAVLRELRLLQEKSSKKRRSLRKTKDKRNKTRRKSKRRKSKRTKVNTNESKQESTIGGRRRKRKSRRRRRY